jgi:ABC-type glycerol-3-phosphate transport system permease component
MTKRTRNLDEFRWWQGRRFRRMVGRIMIYALCISIGLFQVFPMIWMISGSLKKPVELFRDPPMWIPRSWQWQNYAEMWSSLKLEDNVTLAMPHYVMNTLVITAAVLVGTLLSNTLVAFGFARLRARGKEVLFLILLVTMMLPSQMTWLSVYIIMSRLPYPALPQFVWDVVNRGLLLISNIQLLPPEHPRNWIDTYLPLTIPAFFAGPGTVFLLRQFFLTVPLELDEAARIDGASSLRIYWSIFLPQAKPVLASITILTFIGSWKNYFGPLLYLNTPDKFPIALGIQYFRGIADYATQWHLLMAAGVILSIPPFIVFLIFQRYFVEGLALTGLKG